MRRSSPFLGLPMTLAIALTSLATSAIIATCAMIAMTGCDDATTPIVPDAASTDTAGPSATLTPWTFGAGTSAVPTYNKSCRFGATTVFESGSNGSADDTLILESDSNTATLKVTVSDGTSQVLNATVTLERGLADKSWRNGTGSADSATWASGSTGTVVDGAICFENKLIASTAAKGEFTLVMQAPDGSYHSVSGGFVVPAEGVKPASGEAVTSSQLDIDLR